MGRSFKLCNIPFEASMQLVVGGGKKAKEGRQTVPLLIGLTRRFHYAEGTFHFCSLSL